MGTKYTRRKIVYRDVSTGRLLPPHVAQTREPDTYVSREFVIDLMVDDEPFRSVDGLPRVRKMGSAHVERQSEE